jgi:hypothetical protein
MTLLTRLERLQPHQAGVFPHLYSYCNSNLHWSALTIPHFYIFFYILLNFILVLDVVEILIAGRWAMIDQSTYIFLDNWSNMDIILFLLEFINNSLSDWISSLILRHSNGIYKSIFPFAGLYFSPGIECRQIWRPIAHRRFKWMKTQQTHNVLAMNPHSNQMSSFATHSIFNNCHLHMYTGPANGKPGSWLS